MAKKKEVPAVKSSAAGGELVVASSQVTEMAQQLGYDGALTVDALEDGIRIYQRRTVEDCLELGKRLLLLKGITPHGEFSQRIDALGVSDRTAQRFMQAAAKISQNRHLADLSTRVKSVSGILELVTHDDDVLEDLSKMDDIDTMTASELRARVRQLQEGDSEEIANLKKREKNYEAELEKQGLQIKRLTKEKKRLTEFEPRTEEIRQECMALQEEACLPINSLRTLFDELLRESATDPSAESRLRVEHAWIAAHIVAARAMDVLADLYRGTEDLDLPKRALGTHILTPEEAQEWLLAKGMIQNKHEAAKAQRKEAAEAAKPKGPGRPRLPKNKDTE